mmetsp:Transcript_23284/g.88245  ORF Transcript_23284/g.88245 Transcript_23284/m.88245 type:complete len:341 (-) Transcript_23284:91-1113(-)
MAAEGAADCRRPGGHAGGEHGAGVLRQVHHARAAGAAQQDGGRREVCARGPNGGSRRAHRAGRGERRRPRAERGCRGGGRGRAAADCGRKRPWGARRRHADGAPVLQRGPRRPLAGLEVAGGLRRLHRVGVIEQLGHAKVAQLHVAGVSLVHQQHVLGLEVSVHDAQRVQVHDGVRDADGNGLGRVLRVVVPVRDGAKQLPAPAALQDEKQPVRLLIGGQQVDDVRVADPPENLDLLHRQLERPRLEAPLVDHLDGQLPPVAGTGRCHDLCGQARAERLAQLDGASQLDRHCCNPLRRRPAGPSPPETASPVPAHPQHGPEHCQSQGSDGACSNQRPGSA